MIEVGPATKVTIYLNDDTGSQEGFLYQDLLALLQRLGIHGASVLRPYAGFGAHNTMHTEDAGSVAGEHLPILITFVDTVAKVEAILPELLAAVTDGLVEAHPTQVLRSAVAAPRVIT